MGNIEILSGRIENVVYRNESNDYTVLEVAESDSSLVTAVGIMPMAFEGEEVVLRGSYTYHKEFGRQFAFEAFEKNLPKETEGILQYLSSRTVKGVGPVTALKIVNKYGEDTFDVIEHHPEWLADIPGITLKKAAVISESFREQTGIRNVMMVCKDFLGTGEVTRVYKKLGAGAVGILRDNPYILCEGELGIAFEKADAMARSFGVLPDDGCRIISGLEYILKYSGTANGHTCLPRENLVAAGARLLNIDSDTVDGGVSRFIEEERLRAYNKDGVEMVTSSMTAEEEDTVAKKLYSLSKEAVSYGVRDISYLIEKVEASLAISFAPLQREAIFSSLESGVMILTGGPGTGKTTVIKALISIFESLGMKTVLSAPTGRAAKRMSEATSEEAKTVHRMLEMERNRDTGSRFCRNARNPLSEDVVIVDEASMLDLSLTAALLRAMKPSSRLILIGDSDQLPSVGAGNILSDLIESGRIKTVRLTEIFRQSKESLIVTNAHRINSGEAPILSRTDSDFFFVRREDEGNISETIAELIMKRLPRAYGVGVKERIQVITPSKKGQGGVEALNTALQAHLNPPAKFKREKESHGTLFREGDKVMQITNNYDIEWERGGTVGVGLFNGDIGTVVKIDLSDEYMLVSFDEREAKYTFDMLEELELAYAITVHKSQGSEYPVVIMPMYSCPPMLMTRNLLYTAVTRAKSMVILVGKSEIPTRMVENNRVVLRYTTLKDKICDYY